MDDPIIVRYLEDNEKTDRWAVVEPLRFLTPNGLVIVPPGYVTDFASSPAVLWGLFPPIGRHNRDCLLHDFWYDHRLFEAELGEKAARLLADRTLLKGLQRCRPNRRFQNYCMYLACRLFGRTWWRN